MKKYILAILLFIAVIIGGFVFFYSAKPNSDYSAEKTTLNNTNTSLNNTSIDTPKTTVEREISSFSTKIKNQKDLNRQGNISITCSALNNTIVSPGETFSFCDTVGPSTEERGYKEANVIIQGIETKGLGGRKLPS